MSIAPSRLLQVALAGLIVSSTQDAAAQAPATPSRSWELRITGGAFVPTGSLRGSVDDAKVSAAQLSWVLRPSVAITGTLAWARSRDLGSINAPKLDVFTYDVGVETRGSEWFADRAVTLRPFMGLGAGARSYNHRKLDLAATHNPAAYAAAGGEIGAGRVGVRLEVRDYLTGFTSFAESGGSVARNDVVVMAAVRFHRRRSSHN